MLCALTGFDVQQQTTAFGGGGKEYSNALTDTTPLFQEANVCTNVEED